MADFGLRTSKNENDICPKRVTGTDLENGKRGLDVNNLEINKTINQSGVGGPAFRVENAELALAFKNDIDGSRAILTLPGKDTENLIKLINSYGFLNGQSYTGIFVEESQLSKFKTIYFFNNGIEQFRIIIGYNSSNQLGASKILPTSIIKNLYFVQSVNLGKEPIGTLMGVFFAVGGVGVVFTILSDPSGYFTFANNNELTNLALIPEGTYNIIVKAEGNGGTIFIDQFEINVFATALIRNINLSSLIVQVGATVGTTVGSLSTSGGESPITYSIAAQTYLGNPIDVFEIDQNTLKVKNTFPYAVGQTMVVFIRAEDSRLYLPDDLRIKVEEFTITVVSFPFVNSNSLVFNGTDESVEISHDISLWGNTKFSGSFWFKVNNTSTVRYIASKFREAGKRSWGIRINANNTLGVIFSETGIATNTATTVQTITPLVWEHVAFSFDGVAPNQKMKMWLNGILVLDFDHIYNSLYNATVPMYLGALGNYVNNIQTQSDFFSGLLDEISIYNTALNQAEVSEIYNSGSPRNLTSLTSASGLISWWRMGDFFSGGTVPDQVGTNTGNPINMNSSNKSTDRPV